MTTRQLVICDACGRDIESPVSRAWALDAPMSSMPLHFHGVGGMTARQIIHARIIA